jgi:deoxycytidylate deaminase
MNRWMKLAHKLSQDSCHGREKMAAVMVRGGAVVALASNHKRWFGHAELRLLSRVRNAAGSTVYVMRINKRISKPCSICREELIKRGVKDVVYINEHGSVESERLN